MELGFYRADTESMYAGCRVCVSDAKQSVRNNRSMREDLAECHGSYRKQY